MCDISSSKKKKVVCAPVVPDAAGVAIVVNLSVKR